MSEIMSRRDLEFLLYEWLDVEALTTRERYAEHSRETFDGVLELSEQLATDQFAPHNRAADLEEPQVRRRAGPPASRRSGGARGVRRRRTCCAGPSTTEHGGLQLPTSWASRLLRVVPGREHGHDRLPVPHRRQRQPAASRTPRPSTWSGTSGPCWRAGSSAPCACPSRRPAPRSPTSRPAPSPQDDGTYRVFGQQDVDLRRRPRARGQHRAPGARQDPRRPAGHQGHLAVHRAQAPGRRGRLARRAQRRGAGRDQPQDGLPRHGQHRAQLRRRRVHARRSDRRGRLPRRRAAPRAGLHVPR